MTLVKNMRNLSNKQCKSIKISEKKQMNNMQCF